MANELIKISNLTAGTPLATDVIPYVDLVTNTTKKALKSELKGEKGDKGDAATADVHSTETGVAGTDAIVTNEGTTSAALFKFVIPRGDKGETGDAGACVESVEFVGNNIVFTLEDASTVTLVDAKLDLKGDTGDTGASITSAEFVGDDLVFTKDDATTVTLVGAKTALKGDKGDTGDIGIDWQGTWSAGEYTENQAVEHNGTSYIATTTTTETPSTSAVDWDVIALKGVDGLGSGDMLKATYDPANFNSQLEAVSNKKTSLTDDSDTFYPTQKAVKTAVDAKLTSPMTTRGDIIIQGESAAARLAKGTAGQVLTMGANEPEWAAGGGGGSSLWTAFSGTRASNTTITVATDLTATFAKGMIIKWSDSGTKVGMVSIPSTYSDPNTTITIIGDTCGAGATDFYYCLLPAETMNFAIAGTIGATGTDIANAHYARMPYRVIGADLQVGTAGTTNATTIDINIGGTTCFTTKPTLATTVASSPLPFTADTATSLALGNKLTIDVDAVQTTPAVDLYAQLYVFPSRLLTLS